MFKFLLLCIFSLTYIQKTSLYLILFFKTVIIFKGHFLAFPNPIVFWSSRYEKNKHLKCICVCVQDIIKLVVGRLAAGERYFARWFALRLVHIPTRQGYWLHNDLTMYQVRQKYEAKHLPEELR